MKTIIKRWLWVPCVALLVVGLAQAQTSLGNLFQVRLGTATDTLPTCDALREGIISRAAGGADAGTDTRLCFCKSNGADPAVYQWCSITLTGASTVVCAGGSDTVCP